MKKKILLNIIFCILYIYLYDFWFLLLEETNNAVALVIITLCGLFVAFFRNNNKRRTLSLILCFLVCVAQYGLFLLNMSVVILPGLEKALQGEYFGGFGYMMLILCVGGVSLLLVIASFLTAIGERYNKGERQ
jgi:O-antigen ligase